MAKRKQAEEAEEAGNEVDAQSEAAALLRRLVDDARLRDAVSELIGEASGDADAGGGRSGKKRCCGCKGPGKLLLLVVLGALGASAPLREKVLDALFGAEEEFDYTPPSAGSAEANGW